MAHQQSGGFDKSFPNFVVIDGAPADVPAARLAKLRTVLEKTIKKEAGVAVKDVEIPCKADGTTQGVCFVECNNPDDAETLAKRLNGYQFDASHTFQCNLWSDFEIQDSLPATFVPPEVEENPAANMDLSSWLMDRHGNDDFATLVDSFVEINTNSVGGERPILRARKQDWTDRWICWSTRGTYFATVHQPGIALWGGPKFEKIRRFPHEDVIWMEFSPAEKYLVTYSDKRPVDAYVIWNVVTGEQVKTYPKTPQFQAPMWSHDDKFYAFLSQKEGTVHVFDASAGGVLLNKNPIKLSNPITSFRWSPSENILACYVPEVENSPARVALLNMPDRRELNQKILYGVTDCKLHWHPAGDFLAVEVTIGTSKGKKPYTSFELFMMREKGLPVDNLKIEDTCICFEWEPRGKRFGIVHTEDSSSTTRYNVSFYTMEGKQGVKLISTLEKRQANGLSWSPAGRVCVLTGIRSPNGFFDFYDVQEKEMLNAETVHHPLTTDVAWDPTGRYFVTSVSHWKERSENGYMMWSLVGQRLQHEAKTKFFQFVWRPRPPTLLSAEQQTSIEKNLKQISEAYKKEDEQRRKELHLNKRAQKEALAKKFQEFLDKRHAEWVAQTAERRKLRNGYISDDEDESNFIEQTKVVEMIIDEKHEIIAN